MWDDLLKLLLCATFSTANYNRDQRAVIAALGAADLAGIEVASVECLGGCEEPASVGLQGQEMATYVFSGVDVATDVDDIVETCRAYMDAPKGWIENATSCGRLRFCLRARVPALDVG